MRKFERRRNERRSDEYEIWDQGGVMAENMYSPGQRTLTKEGRDRWDAIFSGEYVPVVRNVYSYCCKEKKGDKEFKGRPICKYCFGVRHKLLGEI